MKNEDFKKIISGIESKLGKENTALISDDLGTLISDNLTMNKDISDRDNKIKEQDTLNEKLVLANSSLLQQVGVPDTVPIKKESGSKKEEVEEKTISWEDCFDKKGNFLK